MALFVPVPAHAPMRLAVPGVCWLLPAIQDGHNTYTTADLGKHLCLGYCHSYSFSRNKCVCVAANTTGRCIHGLDRPPHIASGRNSVLISGPCRYIDTVRGMGRFLARPFIS